ncbi:pentapeptide repeat-containing protein [Nostoc sp.]|uniref:pentapeptide repeat-containing protein n=1 Tax=Nostoc sp. TaxID=1180 RepID=UPI002FFC3D76
MTPCKTEKSNTVWNVLILILNFFGNLGKLGILLGATAWVTIDLPRQKKESENKAWQSIITSKNFIQEERKNGNLTQENKSSYISSYGITNNYGIKNALESLTEICKYGEGLDFAVPWKDESFLFIASGWKNVKYALEERGSCVYLSYMNLDYLNLAYIQLEGARLANVSFKNASLFQANLKNGDFQNAVLTNANLTNANLAGTNLTNANLTNANLTNANLTGASYDVTKMQKPNVFLCNTFIRDGKILNPDDDCKQKFEDWKKSLKSKK